MALLHWLMRSMQARGQELADGWNRFWFTPADPTTLAAIRICTGLVLLYVHSTCSAQLLDFIGPNGWVDALAMDRIRGIGQGAPDTWDRVGHGWWGWSLWCHVQQPALLWAVYAGFLLTVLCFTLGLFSRVTSVVVWIGHLSYIHRSFFIWFGLDTILALLTFYLLFGPTGAALSLDCLRARQQNRPEVALQPRWSANLVIRLIQIHMCMIYLCAGLAKLQGPRWWDGTAVWLVLLQPETAPYDLGWLAQLGDTTCLLISNLGVLLTLGLEIGFAFLIWNRTLRPIILILALLVHGGIGLCMGFDAFGAAMLAGCLSFVSPTALRGLIDKLGARFLPPTTVTRRFLRSRKAA